MRNRARFRRRCRAVASRDDDDAVIEVRDSGPGIDQHQRASIFGAFYRTPSAAAGQVQGLGLGLYICRELIEAHGGTIDVEQPEGGGSVFIVRLPIEESESVSPEPGLSEPVMITPADAEPVPATV